MCRPDRGRTTDDVNPIKRRGAMRAFLCVLLVSVGGVCGGADRPDQHPPLLGNWNVAAVFRDGARR